MSIFGDILSPILDGIFGGLSADNDGPAAGMCRVKGTFQTLDSRPAHGVEVVIDLVGADGPAKTGVALLDRSAIRARILNGTLRNAYGLPYQDLRQSDQITPAATQYRFTFFPARWDAVTVTLNNSAFILSEIVS